MPTVCEKCGSEYVYSNFLQCYHCPICTPGKIGPVISKVLTRCPICKGEKAPFDSMCEICTVEAKNIISELGHEKFNPEKITRILTERRLKQSA